MDSIVKAYQNNKTKFDKIKELVEEVEKIQGDKANKIMEIKRIYALVFKNFSTARIPTGERRKLNET